MTLPIKWQTMVMRSASTFNYSPVQARPKQLTQKPTSKKEKLTSMEAEIKKLATTIALMTSKFNGKNINPNKEDHGGSEQNSRRPHQNMGAYCSLHGFHPVGLKHDSTTCNWRKPEHKTEATWSNRLGGDMY
jgi:hypothetical protein